MKRAIALVSAIAVTIFVSNAKADCGKCAAKEAETAKCAAGACSGGACAAGACATEKCTATVSCATTGVCAGGTCTGGSCASGQCPAGTTVAVSTTEPGCCAAQCDASKGCPITAAMEKLPKLTYTVGEKSTACPKEAAKLASDSKGQIQYCLADKKFASESEAQAALIEATETFVSTSTQPHKCPKSGQLTLAGHVQGCEKSAAQTAELMQQAMAKVQLTYVVGDKACNCPIEAGKVAKETGKEKLFVVGTEKTACEKTAKLNLARAKYKAAIEALVKSQASTAKTAPATGT